jgi:ribosomal protein S21
MRIIVKHNDANKAFKLLNRKLHEDNLFIDLKEKQFYKSKSEKRREAKKRAIARFKKEQAKRDILLEKLESQIIRGAHNARKSKSANRGKLVTSNSSGNFKSKTTRSNNKISK